MSCHSMPKFYQGLNNQVLGMTKEYWPQYWCRVFGVKISVSTFRSVDVRYVDFSVCRRSSCRVFSVDFSSSTADWRTALTIVPKLQFKCKVFWYRAARVYSYLVCKLLRNPVIMYCTVFSAVVWCRDTCVYSVQFCS